jgi:tRNA(Arg) A34 adenosine deaminase TadA
VPQHMHHKPTVIGGVLENDCADILKKFFAERR